MFVGFLLLAAFFLICAYLAYKEINRYAHLLNAANVRIQQITTELTKFRNTVITNDFKCFDGVFEIHVTIDPENDYVKLLDFVNKHSKSKGFKFVHAVSSAKNNQYMLSYFTHKTDDQLAVNLAHEFADDLTKLGVRVVRVKVEGYGCIGTPQTSEDYKIIRSFLTKKYNGKSGTPYFEFHAKVSGVSDFKLLDKAIEQFHGTAVSFNLCGSDKKPIITIRVYDQGFISASQYKDRILDHLKSLKFSFESKVMEEFCIYDSHSAVDQGWLVHM
jgi:hypothetical protein